MVMEQLLAVPVGILLGFLSGLGVGGGTLLILWLTVILGIAPAEAREINFLFFLPSAATACFFRWKQGCLPIRKVLPGAIAGCIAAVAGTLLSGVLDTHLLKKGFGLLLVVTGLRELCYKPREKAP